MILEGRAQKTIKKMQEEGKVVTLSSESTYKIDNQLAMRLLPIKEEFYKKSIASKHYIAQLELKTSCN